jgi:hypothetical protein
VGDEDERTAARRAGDTETWDAQAITNLMATPQGRYFMERLLDLTGARHGLYGNDGDALGMAWRDGKAEIGRYLETLLLEHCADRYMQMIRERRQRFDKAMRSQTREQARRDEPNPQRGMTYEEMMADMQKVEAEQAKEKKKRK